MLLPTLWLSLVVTGQGPEAEADHDANAVYRQLLDEGVTLDGKRVAFPPPLLRDGQPPAEQQAALRKMAGSDRRVAELLRDSVTAPIVVKLKDEPTSGGTVRLADVWFAVRADLDAIDPDAVRLGPSDNKPVEAGNMRFTSRILTATELKARRIDPARSTGAVRTWFANQTGRLLDRIHVQMTDVVVATHSAGSWVVATRSDPRFDDAPALANRWWPIIRKGSREEAGPPSPFSGGAGYVKISRLASDPKVLVAEAHFAFAEPRAWFDGAPVLRSKISLIAEQQVRSLRRELARRAGRPGAAAKASGG